MEAVAAAVPLQLQSALSVGSHLNISVMQGLKEQDNFNQDSESGILKMIKTFSSMPPALMFRSQITQVDTKHQV